MYYEVVDFVQNWPAGHFFRLRTAIEIYLKQIKKIGAGKAKFITFRTFEIF